LLIVARHCRGLLCLQFLVFKLAGVVA
jgi:hypothetical protein